MVIGIEYQDENKKWKIDPTTQKYTELFINEDDLNMDCASLSQRYIEPSFAAIINSMKDLK